MPQQLAAVQPELQPEPDPLSVVVTFRSLPRGLSDLAGTDACSNTTRFVEAQGAIPVVFCS